MRYRALVLYILWRFTVVRPNVGTSLERIEPDLFCSFFFSDRISWSFSLLRMSYISMSSSYY